MKRIRVLILTLVLSISMLAPEFSVLQTAYAEEGTPAVEQSNDGDETPQVQTGDPEEAGDVETDPADAPDDSGKDNAGAPDPSGDGTVENGDTSGGAKRGGGDQSEDPEDPVDPGNSEDPQEQEFEFTSYGKLSFVDLDGAHALQIPEGLQQSVSLTHSKYGNNVLVSGSVADLNALRITIGETFDFDAGSVGRLTFDGLRDKDRGMNVHVLVYLDGSDEPVSEFGLKKQMGKKEWTNDGEQCVSLGSEEISGEHTVSIGFRVEGKADDAATTIAIRSMQFCITTLPVLYFNIDESEGTVEAMNASEDHSVECYGTVDLIVPKAFNDDDTFRDEYDVQESKKGIELEYIRGRGNSTWTDPKKPYKVKFAEDQNLFGFGKNKHWILLANRFDNSLIRNRMTYWLGQQLGMKYTPQCVPVEVVMNGEFYGSYLLCEQIRVGKGRVNIDNLDKVERDSPAVTDPLIQSGGYLLSLEYDEDEERAFTTENGMSCYIESPDDNVDLFNEYIKAYMQKVENAIFGEGFKDADGHSYTEYLDLDAAVDYWWIQEFSENGDAYGSGSTYLYKERDKNKDGTIKAGKLYWGPLWDFDYVAWGDLDYESEPSETLDYTRTPWFDMMKSDPVFIAKVKERYTEEGGIHDKIVEITKEGGRLDLYLAQMKTSYEYDHEKWGAFDSELTEYGGEIEQLRSWIIKRTAYVDEAVAELSVEEHDIEFKVDGRSIKSIRKCGMLNSGDFPEAPEKKGYVFIGWVDEEGDYYEEGSRINKDLVLYAYYEREEDLVMPQKIFFKTYEAYYGVSGPAYGGSYGCFVMDSRVMPEGAYFSGISWSSSDESIATVDSDGFVEILDFGDVKITAKLENGVSRSYVLHIVDEDDFNEPGDMKLSKTSMTLKVGGYDQIVATPDNQPCWEPDVMWISSNEKIATVDDIGVVTAVAPGTVDILMVDMSSRQVKKCKVTVNPLNYVGKTVKVKGNTYKITSDKKGKRTVTLVKAKNAKSVVIPATIKYKGKTYSVNKIQAKAFKKSKATKVTIKTKKLTKKTVRNALKGSKVKTIKVKVGKKKINKKFAKKYKKIFTKKNCGKKVKVS